MLPSHGSTYGTFLLAYVARLAPRSDASQWLAAARSHGSLLARAIDLESCADSLIRLRLARAAETVVLAPQLLALSYIADRATLCAIARLLLVNEPPVWLRLAVDGSNVAREYIPDECLSSMHWLEPDLDRVLIEARSQLGDEPTALLRRRLGDAGELYVMAAMRHAGLHPVHVARVTDAYGYDIEIRDGRVDRIEVKAAVPKSRGAFHLSRNEFNKCQFFGREWRLLQVIFATSALVAKQIDASHVEGVYELEHGSIARVVPEDTPSFVWSESAIITMPSSLWHPISLTVDGAFTAPGLAPTVRNLP